MARDDRLTRVVESLRGLAEACWLAAIAVVPLLYHPHSVLGHENLKATWVQGLGWIAGSAVLIGAVAEHRLPGRRWSVRGPAWVLGGLAGLLLLAGFVSVDPVLSFHGDRLTFQGLLQMMAVFFLGLAVAWGLRDGLQLRRLAAVALVPVVPNTLYALLQRFGGDPLAYQAANPGAFGFVGQPIFLAGYLLMLAPLAVWQVGRAGCAGEPTRWRRWVFGGLLILMLAGFLATEKRGAVVAAVAVAAWAGLLIAALRGSQKWVAWGLVAALVAGVALTTLAFLESRGIVRLKGQPVVGRLARIVPVGEGTSDAYRLRVWAAAPRVFGQPTRLPDGSHDPIHALRPLIGYGHETLPAVFPPHDPFSHWESYELRPTRLHNGFWDRAVSTGLAGLVLYFLILGWVFRNGLRAAGLASGGFSPLQVAGVAAIGGVAGGGVLGLTFGPGFFGFGFQLGFGSALAAVPWWLGRGQALGAKYGLPVALMLVVLAHEIDTAFSFPVWSTLAVASVVAGGLIAAGRPSFRRVAEAVPDGVTSILLPGLLGGMAMIAVVHGFVNAYSLGDLTTSDVLRTSLTQVRSIGGPSLLLPVVLIPSALLIPFVVLIGTGIPITIRSYVFSTVITAGIPILYAAWKASSVAAIPGLGVADAWNKQGHAITGMATAILAVGLVGVLGLAMTLVKNVRPVGILSISGAVALGCLFLVGSSAVARFHAESLAGWARALSEAGQAKGAEVVYARALNRFPADPAIRISLAQSIVRQAEAARSFEDFRSGMERAADVLRAGRPYGAMNDVDFFLADTSLRWAAGFPPGSERSRPLDEARIALDRTMAWRPHFGQAAFDRSLVEELGGRTEAAVSWRKRADDASTKADPGSWAEEYLERAQSVPQPPLREAYARRALDYIARIGDSLPFEALMTQAAAEALLGNAGAAFAASQEAYSKAPASKRWRAALLLGVGFAQRGDVSKAKALLSEAAANAPAAEQPRIQAMLRQLR